MNERIIDKIKKLIRHERSVRKGAGTPEEAAAFAERIQKLCIKNKIEVSSVVIEDEQPGSEIGHEDFATGRKERYGWRVLVRGEDRRLMNIVASAHFCQSIVITHSVAISARRSRSAIQRLVQDDNPSVAGCD